MGRHALESHLKVKRRISWEPPGEHGDDLGHALRLIRGRVPVPEAGGEGDRERQEQGDGEQLPFHGCAPGGEGVGSSVVGSSRQPWASSSSSEPASVHCS